LALLARGKASPLLIGPCTIRQAVLSPLLGLKVRDDAEPDAQPLLGFIFQAVLESWFLFST
jgi:hypothetical protein